jgi:hypothetical protein
MAKSRSESPLRSAKGKKECLARAKMPDRISSPSKYLISSPLTGED